MPTRRLSDNRESHETDSRRTDAGAAQQAGSQCDSGPHRRPDDGYLSREDAEDYRPGLMRLMERSENGLVALNATIVDGGQRSEGPGRLGIFLDHDPADFGVSSALASSLRSGLTR